MNPINVLYISGGLVMVVWTMALLTRTHSRPCGADWLETGLSGEIDCDELMRSSLQDLANHVVREPSCGHVVAQCMDACEAPKIYR